MIRVRSRREQRRAVRNETKNATGKDAQAVELSAEELEERIAPRHFA
jgi:hypothetical protein